ncbi:MAG: tetratricopeptide repeat protein [Xanthomonadaceae bacterium]|nr:tetratricopeptide repeat protein [Xanthomonadaceae bacterium]
MAGTQEHFRRRSRAGRVLAAAALSALLAGCASAPPQPAAPVPASISTAALIASIRAAGAQEGSIVNVAPLRPPGVQALLDQVKADEIAGHWHLAAQALDQALALDPHAPDVLQDRAEVAVALARWAQAETLALRSWALGPRVGALCARNWQTVLEMRQITGTGAGTGGGVARARAARDACRVSGPPQM